MQMPIYRNDFLKIILLIICFIVAMHIYSLPVWANKLLKPGTKAPDFKYTDSAGKQKELSEVKGEKIILLYFWDNDPPGVSQKPNAEGLNYAQLINRQYSSDVLVLTIFISEPSAKLYGVEDVTPVWYLIDYEGKIYYVYDGNLGKATTKVLGDKIVSLKKDFLSKLLVFFEPTDADVFLNGSPINLKGKTPSTIENIKPGTYTLKITKTGYKTWQEIISLSRGEVKTIRVNLAEEPGILDVRVKPDNSVVYLNGERKGTTPLSLELKPGTYKLQISNDDSKYLKWGPKDIVIEAEKKQIIQDTLLPIMPVMGKLKIFSTPTRAKVFVDFEEKGYTPCSFEIPPGRHRVMLKKEGFRPSRQIIVVKAGQTIPINISLKTSRIVYDENFHPELEALDKDKADENLRPLLTTPRKNIPSSSLSQPSSRTIPRERNFRMTTWRKSFLGVGLVSAGSAFAVNELYKQSWNQNYKTSRDILIASSVWSGVNVLSSHKIVGWGWILGSYGYGFYRYWKDIGILDEYTGKDVSLESAFILSIPIIHEIALISELTVKPYSASGRTVNHWRNVSRLKAGLSLGAEVWGFILVYKEKIAQRSFANKKLSYSPMIIESEPEIAGCTLTFHNKPNGEILLAIHKQF